MNPNSEAQPRQKWTSSSFSQSASLIWEMEGGALREESDLVPFFFGFDGWRYAIDCFTTPCAIGQQAPTQA